MKLPSLNQLFDDSRAALTRFPAVLLLALVGTAAAIIIIHHEGPSVASVIFPVFFAATLGLPLFLAIILTAESQKWTKTLTWGMQAVALLLIIAYGATIPRDFENATSIHAIRFFILGAMLVLGITILPFSHKGEWNGFWQYNKALLLRALTAVLFTHVLWIGLSVALLAVQKLFNVSVPGRLYPEMWAFLNGIFCIWFFLSGIPDDLRALESETDYPKALKIFAQYILFPLVIVYFVILYAYLLKIVVAWQWPEGWVSKLILGFAGVGIAALLLLHPLIGREGQSWVKKATRWFYPALAPVVVMLFLAVWRRESEYAWTEGRYMAVALGVWLAFLSGYFMVSRTKSIKVIPASLAVLLLVVSVGPWGVFAVSERSQVDRLKTVLLKNDIFVNGKITAQHGKVSVDDAKEISGIITYLHEVHGYGSIEEWFVGGLPMDSISSARIAPAALTTKMGVDYTNAWRLSADRNVDLRVSKDAPIDIHEYQYYVRGVRLLRDEPSKKGGHEGLSCNADKDRDTMHLMFRRGDRMLDTLSFDVRSMISAVLADSSIGDLTNVPLARLTAAQSGKLWKAQIIVTGAYIDRQSKEKVITWSDCDVMYSLIEQNAKP